jgi:uncharacterized protein (DUF952 family)
MIYHLAESADWAARTDSVYRAPSLLTEQFIHCATREQLPGVADRYYAGRTDLILLAIDPSRLTSPLVYENSTGGDELFPHLYGPIPLVAIVSARPFVRESFNGDTV